MTRRTRPLAERNEGLLASERQRACRGVPRGGTLWPTDAPPWALGLGSAFIATGQALNIGVFWRLGNTGVFYGNRFGHEIEWSQGFPFSVAAHPQYVGVALTIWGVFLILRFPHGDWMVPPALETAYYILGARLERAPRDELQPGHQSFT